MSSESVYDTAVAYIENCKTSQQAPHALVLDALQRLKDATAFDDSDDGASSSSSRRYQLDLKLCANNKLTNPRGLRIDDAETIVLCKTLTAHGSAFASLDLRYNSIGDAGACAIADMLAAAGAESGTGCSITLLNLMCNNIGESGAAAIAKALRTNECLQELCLAGNKIGNSGGMRFAEALQVNATLECLDLGDCDLRIDAVIALSTVLKANSSLRSLNVNRPLLWTQQEETTVHMGEMLAQNRSLRELHLAKYEMRDFGACRMSDGLAVNASLTVLDLSCNRITRDGAKALAGILARDTPLQVLDLSYNRLECDGAKCIAGALMGANSNLRCLAVKFNEIKSDGLVALANALKFNTSLDRLFVWGNDLSDEAAATAFAEVTCESGRLGDGDTDVRAYRVDDRWWLAQLNVDVEYRLYRYAAPVYGDKVPTDRRHRLS